MGYPICKNRMVDGGDRWEIDGHLDRPGVPVLDLTVLKAMLIQHYAFAPALQTATFVHAAVTLTDAAQNVTSAITQPDFPRTVTVKGNAAGIAGNVVITGTNINDETISDTIALADATEVEGVKAFKTITNINLPVKTNVSGDTVSVGVGKKFGIPHVVGNAAFLIVKLFNGSSDSGSLSVDAALEKNIFSLNGTPNGTKIVDLVYLV